MKYQTATVKPLYLSTPTIVTINLTFVTQLPTDYPSLPNYTHSKSAQQPPAMSFLTPTEGNVYTQRPPFPASDGSPTGECVSGCA